MTDNPDQISDHVVVLGYDAFSRSVVEELVTAENQVVIVTDDPDDLEEIGTHFDTELVSSHQHTLAALEGLDSVNIRDSRKVFVNLDCDHRELQAVLELQALYGDELQIDVVIDNEELEQTFRVAGVTYVISPEAMGANVVASYIFEEEVGVLASELLMASHGASDCEFQQYRILADHHLVGQPYDEVFWKLKDDYNTAVLGLARIDADGTRNVYKLPKHDLTLEQGDYIIVLSDGHTKPKLEELFGIREGIVRSAEEVRNGSV